MDEREKKAEQETAANQNDSIAQQNEMLKKVVLEQQALLQKMRAEQQANEQKQAEEKTAQNGYYTMPNGRVYNTNQSDYGYNSYGTAQNNDAVQSQVHAQSQFYRSIHKKQFARYVSNALKVAAVLFAIFMLIIAIILTAAYDAGGGFVMFLIYTLIGFIGTVALLGTAAIIDTMIEIKEDLEDL